MLDETWGRDTSGPAEPSTPGADAPRPELSPYQFAKAVERSIDSYVRPMLVKDGGDIEIVDIKDRLVYVQLAGACVGCAGASMTLKLMVEQTLKAQVDEGIRVIAV